MTSCDPRFKLVGFGLLLPIVMSAPVFSPVWLAGSGLVLLVIMAASLPLAQLGGGLFRLRWLFLALLLTHGWFTPGVPLGFGMGFLTQEGVLAGVYHSIRLVLLALLAWGVMRTTTPMELVGVFYYFLGGLERFGVPVQRGLSILALCLTSLPRLMADADRVREGMMLRLGPVWAGGVMGRMERLVFAGEALLLHLLWEVRQLEEGVRARGFGEALPPVRLHSQRGGWRDWGLLLPPVFLWLWW